MAESRLNIKVPFVISKAIDPTAVNSVGDQMLSEHLFAFHGRSTEQGGFEGVASSIEFNSDFVALHPRKDLKYADGRPVTFEEICTALRNSLSGTRHAAYAKLLKGVECNTAINTVSLKFEVVPVNLRNLFTLPDYSIYDSASLPVIAGSKSSTGPYYLATLNEAGADLLPNLNFPSDLVSNRWPVSISRFRGNDSPSVARTLKKEAVDAAYFYGHAVDKETLENVESQGYRVEVFPAEWLVYFSFSSATDIRTRKVFSRLIDEFKQGTEFRESLGEAAYSLSPGDRAYGLDSFSSDKASDEVAPEVLKGLRVATLDSWQDMDIFRKLISFLKLRAPYLELDVIPTSEIGRLFSGEFAIALTPLGMSPTDPLTHLNYLSKVNPLFAKIVSRDRLAKVATLIDEREFSESVKKIETEISEEHLIIPVGHFPGIVATMPEISINKKQNFGWGIQAWSFQRN